MIVLSKKLSSASDFTKGHLIIATVLPFYLSYILLIKFITSLEDIPSAVHLVNTEKLEIAYYWIIAVSVGFMVLGEMLRSFKVPAGKLYMLMALTATVTFLTYSGHQVGALGMPAGVVLMSAAMLGIMLIDLKIVLLQVFFSVTCLFGSSIAASFGYIEYSPVIIGSPTGGEHPELFWVMAMIFFCTPFIFIFFLFCVFLVRQWEKYDTSILESASTDPLTKLYNRRFLMDKFKRELSICERRTSSSDAVSCIILDLDHFKSINDTHGHQMGDDVLVSVASALKNMLRDYDVAGRYGGEEFLIILPNTPSETAGLVAQRCREKILELHWALGGGDELRVSASFGVSTSMVGVSVSVSDMIKAADKALYVAKESGRNQVVIADAEVGA